VHGAARFEQRLNPSLKPTRQGPVIDFRFVMSAVHPGGAPATGATTIWLACPVRPILGLHRTPASPA